MGVKHLRGVSSTFNAGISGSRWTHNVVKNYRSMCKHSTGLYMLLRLMEQGAMWLCLNFALGAQPLKRYLTTKRINGSYP
jgi:hypothetical protein